MFHLKPIAYPVCVPHLHDQKTAASGVWKWEINQFIFPYLGIRVTSAICLECAALCSPSFPRSSLPLVTLETLLDLTCSAGILQSFIYFIILCNLARILPCSLQYGLSPHVQFQHLPQRGPCRLLYSKNTFCTFCLFLQIKMPYTDFSGNMLQGMEVLLDCIEV